MARISKNGLWDAFRTSLAAMPLLFAALVYALARASGGPVIGIEADWLRKLLVVELLAIHSFPIMGLLALCHPATPEYRGLRWLAIAAATLLYLPFLYDLGGWHGLAAFVSLSGVTYLGFFLHWTPSDAAARLTGRWMVNFAVFAVTAVIVSLRHDGSIWTNSKAGLTLGAWYFGVSALIELTGFYRSPMWSEFGEDFWKQEKKTFAKRSIETGTIRATLWRAFVPLAGTALLVFGPLYSSAFMTAVAGRIIKSHYAWPDDDFLMQFWLPVIMTSSLLALRAWHIVWVTNVFLPDAERPWWKRPILMAVLAAIAAMYLSSASDFRADATEVANYRSFVPRITYQSYSGIEGLLAIVLIPLSWWTIGLAARRAREGLGAD